MDLPTNYQQVFRNCFNFLVNTQLFFTLLFKKNNTIKHTTNICYCNDDDKHIDYNGIDHDNNTGNDDDDNMIRIVVKN